MSNSSFFKKGMKDGIPIFLGYLAVSFTIGILAKQKGLTVLEAVFMSATNLTSAGQADGIKSIAASATYFEMAITQFIINLRYCLMSSALSQKISSKRPFFHRFIMAFGVTDEIFGLSINVEGKINPFYSYGIMSVAIPGWVFGTLFGIVLGDLLPARVLGALGVAIYGMFIAIIIPPSRKNKVLAGLVVISMAMSFIFSKAYILRDISSGFRIIILTFLIAGVAAILFPIKETKDEKGREV